MDFVRTLSKVVFSATDLVLPALHGPRILLYHQVGIELGRQMEVSLKTFRAHLDWLQENGEVIDLQSALNRRGEPDNDRLFVLTFDDGYADIFYNAFPLIQDRGLPFTIYLTTEPVERGVPLTPGAAPLSWDQANVMLESGLLTIGAHTHTHVDVRSVGRDRLIDEVETSNALIANRTGVMARHFAYPWGYWSGVAESVVADHYQSAALASVVSLAMDTNPLRLPRIPIQKADGSRFFRRKMDRGLRVEDWARRLVKRYSVPSSTGSFVGPFRKSIED